MKSIQRGVVVVVISVVSVFGLAVPVLAQQEPDSKNLMQGHALKSLPTRTDQVATAEASTQVGFDYPSNESFVVGSYGFIDAEQVGYFWSVSRGDSVVKTFIDAPSINSYTLAVDVVTNVLNGGGFVNWNLIINGRIVDNFTVYEGFVGTVNRTATFAPIVGPNYTVELRVTNDVAQGLGSHTFRFAGAGSHQIRLFSTTECEIQLNQAVYVDGETVTASVYRFANNDSKPTAVEIKVWFGGPGGATASVINAGADGSFVLPAGFDQNFGPIPLFTITPAYPRGSYEFSCRMLNPVTGAELWAHLKPFRLQ